MEANRETLFEDAFWALRECYDALEQTPIAQMQGREQQFAMGIQYLWEKYAEGKHAELLNDLNKMAGK